MGAWAFSFWSSLQKPRLNERKEPCSILLVVCCAFFLRCRTFENWHGLNKVLGIAYNEEIENINENIILNINKIAV